MAPKLSQIMEQIPPSRQKKIEGRADELIAKQATICQWGPYYSSDKDFPK